MTVFGPFLTHLLRKMFLYWQKKSNSERIEEDLVRARAVILKAVHLHNFTSEKEEIFIPRGSIYRNAYAFYQLSTFFRTHIDYVYDQLTFSFSFCT